MCGYARIRVSSCSSVSTSAKLELIILYWVCIVLINEQMDNGRISLVVLGRGYMISEVLDFDTSAYD